MRSEREPWLVPMRMALPSCLHLRTRGVKVWGTGGEGGNRKERNVRLQSNMAGTDLHGPAQLLALEDEGGRSHQNTGGGGEGGR